MDLYTLTSQEILDRISRHCPSSLSTYLQCINRANNSGNIVFDKRLVEVDMSESWTRFRNHLKKLALENLLEWHPFGEGISVTLAAIDEDD
jgi:hypothetical protein